MTRDVTTGSFVAGSFKARHQPILLRMSVSDWLSSPSCSEEGRIDIGEFGRPTPNFVDIRLNISTLQSSPMASILLVDIFAKLGDKLFGAELGRVWPGGRTLSSPATP